MAVRWIIAIIYVPTMYIFRRWGWFGIAAAWGVLIVFGALNAWLGKGQDEQASVAIGSALLLCMLLWWRTAHPRSVMPSRGLSLGRAGDEVGGQGVFATDWLYFQHLTRVLEHRGQHSAEEIAAIVQTHARRLADPDPNAAWNYRQELNRRAAVEWPAGAGLSYSSDLQARLGAHG